jgi:hypothetical protein
VNVLVNSSDLLNGFDITLLTNRTVLKPAGVSILNTVLPGTPTELLKCIGGVKLGSGPCSSNDNTNTLHYSVQAGQGQATTPPTTGLLFTAIYNVTAISTNTPITFQTGCTATSVPGGICVKISNGSTSTVPETAQTAKFSNAQTGYFDIEANVGSLHVSQGDFDATTAFLTLTSLNNFGGTTGSTVNLSALSSPTGPIVTVSPTSVILTAGSTTFVNINVTVPKTILPGTYLLNFTGISGTLPPNSITIQLIIPAPDFGIKHNPDSLFFNVTASGTATITISSSGNFAGKVNLTLTPLPGLKASLRNTQLTLSSKGTNSTLLTLNSTIARTYNVTITATATSPYGPLTHVTAISVTILDFFLTISNTGILTILNGTSNVEKITVGVNDLYNVTVRVTTIYIDQILKGTGIVGPSTGGLSVSCNPTNIVIISTKNAVNGTKIGFADTNCLVNGVAVGNYFVTVITASGVQNRTSTHAVSFQVAVIAPNFSVVLPSTITTVSVDSSTTIPLRIFGNNGLNDNVTVSLVISSSSLSPLPTFSQSARVANVTKTNPNATILVTITASSATPSGTYMLTITSAGKYSQPGFIVTTLLFLVTSTTSPHDLGVYSVTPSTTSATIGSDVTITIIVQNLGKIAENATIQAIVGDQTIGVKNATITPGGNVTVTITWHTTGYSPGAYMIGGKVLGVPGETILSNNLLRSATPVTLNVTNTSILQSPYTIAIVAIASILVVAAGLALYFLSRRKIKSA